MHFMGQTLEIEADEPCMADALATKVADLIEHMDAFSETEQDADLYVAAICILAQMAEEAMRETAH